MSIRYRTADHDDARAAARVVTLALNDLATRQDRPLLDVSHDHPDRGAPAFAHLIETDGSRFWVAVDGDDPVGFGAAWVRGKLSYCGGLFVLPEWQGQGVGGRLFELAFTGLPIARGRAALTSSAANPVSNGIYARRGIFPLFALLSMTGPVLAPSTRPDRWGGPRASPAAAPALPSVAGDLEVDPLDLAHLDALIEIDEAVLGIDRTVDHRWYLGRAGNPGWLFSRRGRAAGYAYLGGDGTEGPGVLGPVATLRAKDQQAVLRFALAELAARGAEGATVIVPGPNITAQRLLWRAGFTFTGAAGLLCASRPFGHFDRYLLSGDCLM
jgi:ribosomal protein S18 acetylase RimI-like enzyme